MRLVVVPTRSCGLSTLSSLVVLETENAGGEEVGRKTDERGGGEWVWLGEGASVETGVCGVRSECGGDVESGRGGCRERERTTHKENLEKIDFVTSYT